MLHGAQVVVLLHEFAKQRCMRFRRQRSNSVEVKARHATPHPRRPGIASATHPPRTRVHLLCPPPFAFRLCLFIHGHRPHLLGLIATGLLANGAMWKLASGDPRVTRTEIARCIGMAKRLRALQRRRRPFPPSPAAAAAV